MKKNILIITSIITVMVLIFAGCASKAYEETNVQTSSDMSKEGAYGDGGFGMMAEAPAVEPSYDMENNDTLYDDNQTESMSEKIIYNVYTYLLCDDVALTVEAITTKTEALGGYVSYSNTYNSEGNSYASMEVRIPSNQLDYMEEYTYELGDVEEHTKSSENITDSYYDIVARLDVNLAQEAQLLEILDQADTIEDILLVRSELLQVQEQIESYKGRIRLWDSLVDYSTITYTIRPQPTLDNDADDTPRIISFGETWRAMQRGFKNTGIGVVNFFSWILRVLAALAIPLLICGLVALLVIWLVRKGKGKKQE